MTNPYDGFTVAGTEVSSTYEGRHVTLIESEIMAPAGLTAYGDPVLGGGNIVGVALGTATAAGSLVPIDTEGIWALEVSADDELGTSAVVVGDEIFIDKTTGALSKRYNKNTHQRFGYALKAIAAGNDEVIAVKVHWDPDDAEEIVGRGNEWYADRTAPLTGFNFREYRYRTICTSGDTRGMYMALALSGIGGNGEAVRGRTIIEAVGTNGGHGGHFGIEYDTDGTHTGLAVGLRGTHMAPNRAMINTLSGGMSELWAEGATTDYGPAMHSIHRFVMDGDAVGMATADNVFEFAGLSAVQLQDGTPTANHVLRCIINGAIRFIMVSTTA